MPKWSFAFELTLGRSVDAYLRCGMASLPLPSPWRGAAPRIGSPGSGSVAGAFCIGGTTTVPPP